MPRDDAKMADLFRITDEACDYALSHQGDFAADGINWGDLGCVDVEYIETMRNGTYYRVRVEEASPTSMKLRDYIAAQLGKAGYTDQEVEICIEW